jgi:hypothetical protein
MLSKVPMSQGADMQDADYLPVGEEWCSHQGPDALGQQDRIHDPAVIHFVEDHRPGLGGDTAGEAGAERHPGTLPYLFLQAVSGSGDEVTARRIHEQDR